MSKIFIQEELPSLCEYYKKYFRLGTALNHFALLQQTQETELVKKHFNLVVAENATKMENIFLSEDNFNFSITDKFLDFGKNYNKDLRWHTLLWHNQAPKWIFNEPNGDFVSEKLLNKRLKTYIQTITDYTKDKVYSYDVINEPVSDKTYKLRTLEDGSKWFHILGPEYIENAFFWTREANPNAELVFNDYNLESVPQKRQAAYDILKDLLIKKVPVDTVGIQMHVSLNNPPVSEIEKTFDLFASLGLRISVSEMDVSVYEFEETETKIYTRELLQKQAQRYEELFECFKKYAQKGILTDVVLWGVTDKTSWKNNFPVPKRTDIPLLFDKNGIAKPCFYSLIKN